MKLTLEEANAIMNRNNGNLNLSRTHITSLPANLKVSGWLDLSYTRIITLPDNLTVGNSAYLYETEITSLPNNLTVGDAMYLCETEITSLPNNLTVGGPLDLNSTKITALSDNLTVGGWLDLRETPITSLPNNLTVGGVVMYDESKIADREIKKIKTLQDGDYIEGRYLYADGILTHIKKKKEIGKYTLFIGKIPNRNVIFDGMYYAHCSTFREGKSDLLFKHAKDRGMEQYKGLSLDTELTADEMITMYRIITGACRQGTETFVNSLGKLKDRYTIGEALEITKGQYGAKQFAGFFS